MRLIINVFIFLVFVGVIGLLVFYNQELTAISGKFVSVQDGERAMRNNHWDRAMVLYEEAYEKDDKNLDVALNLARVYHRQSQNYASQGFVEYKAGSELSPVKKRKSVTEMKNQARVLFKDVLEKDKESAEAKIAYVQYLQDTTTHLGEAVKLYREGMKTHSRDPKFVSAVGDLYKVAAENPQENRISVKNWLFDWSVYYFRTALKMDPRMFQPRFNLAVVYHLRHAKNDVEKNTNLVRATREYCNALQVYPESYEARYNLGLALVDMGAVEPGFRELAHSVSILAENDRVSEAQQLAQQIQAVRNSIYYDEPEYQVRYDDLDQWPWLASCLGPSSSESDSPEL